MRNPCFSNISNIGFAARVVTHELVHGESSSSATIVKDICKDGGLLKMILKEGGDWENPNDPDDVLGIYVFMFLTYLFFRWTTLLSYFMILTLWFSEEEVLVIRMLTINSSRAIAVKYEARLDDGTLVKKSDGVEFTVKDGQCVQTLLLSRLISFSKVSSLMFSRDVIGHFCLALSKAVKTMKKGEIAILTVKPQCKLSTKQVIIHHYYIAPFSLQRIFTSYLHIVCYRWISLHGKASSRQ
jgi:hypothetical protein